MRTLDPTPRTDCKADDLPGWPVEEVEQIQRQTHAEKLAARLERQGIRKRVTETRIEYRRLAALSGPSANKET